MKRRIFFSSLAAGSLVSVLRPSLSPASQRTQSNPKLDIDALLSVTEVPSIAVAGTIQGKPFQQFAGVRSVVDKTPVTAETWFSAASLSKPVFAWAVRDLVKKGKLDWAKPLQDYADLGLSGEAKRITAAHVLSHSTGLPNWRFQLDKPLTSDFLPGTKWQYSGEGYVLLQRVVEGITRIPIAAYLKQNVLAPMGMMNSSYAWTPEIQARSTMGHDRRANPLEKSSVYYAQRNYDVLQKADVQPDSANYAQMTAAYEKAKSAPLPVAMAPNMAGSLWTTAPDYAKFLQRVLTDIPAHADDYRAHVKVNARIAWTLGWGVDESFARPALFHWGDGPGFKNFAWVQPERKTALVFFTNGDHGQQLYSAVFRRLLADDPASLYWI